MNISIVIPTYNSRQFLKKALDSIFIQKYKEVDVIVIDNASSDGTFEDIKNQFPSVKAVRNNQNKGACLARNQGIELAKDDYIMLMDCDVELADNFFLALETVFKKLSQDVAGISPKIIDKNSKKIFSCGLRVFPIYRTYDIGRGKSADNFLQPFAIDGPNSCCAVFRKEYLEKIKERDFFDEDFFFLFEDADLALRLKQKGYSSFFAPELICYHRGNSSATSKEFRRYLSFRNRWYMILKFKKKKQFLLFLLRSFFYDFFRTVHFTLTNRYSLVAFKDIYKKIRVQRNMPTGKNREKN